MNINKMNSIERSIKKETKLAIIDTINSDETNEELETAVERTMNEIMNEKKIYHLRIPLRKEFTKIECFQNGLIALVDLYNEACILLTPAKLKRVLMTDLAQISEK